MEITETPIPKVETLPPLSYQYLLGMYGEPNVTHKGVGRAPRYTWHFKEYSLVLIDRLRIEKVERLK